MKKVIHHHCCCCCNCKCTCNCSKQNSKCTEKNITEETDQKTKENCC